MNSKNPLRRFWLATLLLAFASGFAPFASAFIHPCIPTTLQELDTIKANKANLDKEPWKPGYAYLAGGISTNYTMQGPFATVSRTPDVNLSQWKNDMGAVHSLALMWYFTGNTNYAEKAIQGCDAWSSKMTNGVGGDSNFALGAGICGYEFAVAAATTDSAGAAKNLITSPTPFERYVLT